MHIGTQRRKRAPCGGKRDAWRETRRMRAGRDGNKKGGHKSLQTAERRRLQWIDHPSHAERLHQQLVSLSVRSLLCLTLCLSFHLHCQYTHTHTHTHTHTQHLPSHSSFLSLSSVLLSVNANVSSFVPFRSAPLSPSSLFTTSTRNNLKST